LTSSPAPSAPLSPAHHTLPTSPRLLARLPLLPLRLRTHLSPHNAIVSMLGVGCDQVPRFLYFPPSSIPSLRLHEHYLLRFPLFVRSFFEFAHIQVTPARTPFLGLLDAQRRNQPQACLLVGEDPNHPRTPLPGFLVASVHEQVGVSFSLKRPAPPRPKLCVQSSCQRGDEALGEGGAAKRFGYVLDLPF
jgi:hypothetical protein